MLHEKRLLHLSTLFAVLQALSVTELYHLSEGYKY